MADPVNKKTAPQRAVIDVERTGGWGAVEYRHRLECGHTEVRKRIMPTKKIACTSCVLAGQMDDRVSDIAVRSAKIIDPMDVMDIVGDDLYGFANEVDISKAQAAIALRIGVPVDSVDVVAEVGPDGDLKISYATIFIEASIVYRLIAGD
jgi:hypothetical protein